MIKRIIAVETNTYPLPNLTGVSTELNLSHMEQTSGHLRGNSALSYSGPPDHSPYKEEEGEDIPFQKIHKMILLLCELLILTKGQSTAFITTPMLT